MGGVSRITLCAVMIPLLVIIAIPVESSATFGNDQRDGYFGNVTILPILEWKAHLSGLVGSSPVYYEGRVFATNWYGWGEWEPGLYCINASDGEILWKNPQITGASSVAVNDSGDFLVVGSLSGKLYAVRVDDGTILWSKRLESNPQWWGIASSPLIYDRKIYVTTFSDSTIHALDFSGNEVWNFTAGGENSKYTSPEAYEGRILFAGVDGNGTSRLYCFDENGDLLWSVELDGNVTSTPAASNGTVYVATDRSLNAVDINGTVRWHARLNGTISTPAVVGGRILVGGKTYFHCFSTKGKELWRFRVDGKVDSSPAISGNTVYFATNTPEGTIYALNISTGELEWMYRLKPPAGFYYNIMSSPVVAGDKLFIGADSGDVFCFSNEGVLKANVTVTPGSVDAGGERIDNFSSLGTLIAASKGSDTGIASLAFDLKLTSGGVEEIMGIRCNWSIVRSGSSVIAECAERNVTLNLNVKYMGTYVRIINVSEADRGGFSTVWVGITGAGEGWKVVVVSGTNAEGESIGGISTFKADDSSISVPVIVPVPQQVSGRFTVYAGLYNLSDFPMKLLTLSKGVEVDVQ